jgi:hypothetical protein
MMQTDRRTSATAHDQTAAWLKQMGIQPIGPPGDGEVLLSEKTLRDFFDGCSKMKLCRLRESKGLPQPLRFARRLYTPRSQFYAWLKGQIEAGERVSNNLKGRPPADQPEAQS